MTYVCSAVQDIRLRNPRMMDGVKSRQDSSFVPLLPNPIPIESSPHLSQSIAQQRAEPVHPLVRSERSKTLTERQSQPRRNRSAEPHIPRNASLSQPEPDNWLATEIAPLAHPSVGADPDQQAPVIADSPQQPIHQVGVPGGSMYDSTFTDLLTGFITGEGHSAALRFLLLIL